MGFDKDRRKRVFLEGSAVYALRVYSETLTPSKDTDGISMNSTSPIVFTLTGLTTDDKILTVELATNTSLAQTYSSPIVITAYRVHSDDKLEITFANLSTESASPVTGTYKIVVLRAVSGDEI